MKDLYELQKRLFLEVRDMPFEIIPGTSLDYQKAIESIKKYKKGSCTSKHFFLGYLYQQLGLNVLYKTYLFYWVDQEFLNEELRHLARNLPEQYHLALYVEGRLIDATFDKLLNPIFPVNEFENCKVSIEYVDEITHSTPLERISFVKERVKTSPFLQKFYSELNEYTRKLRTLHLRV